MQPFERNYRMGVQMHQDPTKRHFPNPVFTNEEKKIMISAMKNLAAATGRDLTNQEQAIFVSAWTSGICYIGASGNKIIFLEI